MGAFSYSVEEGTPAADLDPQAYPAASQEVVEARIGRVLTLRDAHLAQDQNAQVGRTLEVLVDEGPDSEGWARGRSDQDAPEVDLAIQFMAPGASVGDRVQVKIEEVMESLDLSGVREGS
jgi:ribosomal protein S12 methylthiotransferase